MSSQFSSSEQTVSRSNASEGESDAALSDDVNDHARNDRHFVEALARGFRVLESFEQSAEPKSLSEIAAITGYDKSAVQRLVHTLAAIGYLEKRPAGVAPGRKLLERSFDYLRSNPLVNRAVPILADLRKAIRERVDLSLFNDTSMLYAIRMQSKRETFFAHLVGRKVPTFCTSGGRAVLAHLPTEERMDILTRSDRRQITPRTTTDMESILAEIDRVRETGYSLALEQILLGEIVIAAPVFGVDGRPVGAIHVAASLAEWKPQELVSRAGPLVIAAANSLRPL